MRLHDLFGSYPMCEWSHYVGTGGAQAALDFGFGHCWLG